MNEISILLTGNYWHSEFSDLIAGARDYSVALQDLDGILEHGLADIRFQLVVVAQARRDQFFAKQLEKLTQQFIHIPVVLLCGSWCEGEPRSGNPVPGLTRVYWHQWEGRFENFQAQLQSSGVTTWHMPRIATMTDHIQNDVSVSGCLVKQVVGVSALNRQGFEMVATSIQSSECVWIKSSNPSDQKNLTLICIEANSLSEETQDRVRNLRTRFPQIPIVMTLNFPRRSDFEIAARLGIAELVSKPFQLSDLQFAIQRASHPKAA